MTRWQWRRQHYIAERAVLRMKRILSPWYEVWTVPKESGADMYGTILDWYSRYQIDKLLPIGTSVFEAYRFADYGSHVKIERRPNCDSA